MTWPALSSERLAGVGRDVRTLTHLLRPLRDTGASQWMERFYAPQAQDYDRFRERMLLGRQQLVDAIDWHPGSVWIDLGGGTGRAVEFLGDRLAQLSRVYVVDATRPLLDEARRRRQRQRWSNVQIMHADASTVGLPRECADVVTCMYSLSMMAAWPAVIDRALALLRPGGVFGVVDYYAPDRLSPDAARHGWFSRSWWPLWFRRCGVDLGPERLRRIRSQFSVEHFEDGAAPLPYVPGARVPYFLCVARRRAAIC